MKKGQESPWGPIQEITDHGQGILTVYTASHGGVYVPPELLNKIPTVERNFAARWSYGWGECWFEEDCAAISPIFHFNLMPDKADKVTAWYEQQKWN